MVVDLLLLSLGIALLLVGGEAVVRGSIALARALGVSPLVIGLTVVAFGTSSPELAVNLIAISQGHGEIAFGNILGSNMANIGLIVGCTALVRRAVIQDVVITREIPMMLLATGAVVVMGFDGYFGKPPDAIDRGDGMLLLMLLCVFLYYTAGDFLRRRIGEDEQAEGPRVVRRPVSGDTVWNLVITLGGLTLLIGGGAITVGAAEGIARALGVPEVVIGLTVLALGTSLPELVTSILAMLRGHAELVIGNVVGSNIFNLLLVLAATSLLGPVPVPAGGHGDLFAVSVLSLVLLGVCTTHSKRIVRSEAAFLLLFYLVYLVWRSSSAVS